MNKEKAASHMDDKIIAPIAMGLFLIFIGFIAIYINRPNLWVVVVVVSALAVYDFWDTVFRKGGIETESHTDYEEHHDRPPPT